MDYTPHETITVPYITINGKRKKRKKITMKAHPSKKLTKP